MFCLYLEVLKKVFSMYLFFSQIVLMEDDNAVVSGIVSILDLDGVKMGHFLQMTPMLMKKMVVSGQVKKCYSYYFLYIAILFSTTSVL